MNYRSTILAACFVVGACSISNAQDIDKKDVPAAVKSAFQKAYPKATDVEWELKNSNYEVEFDIARADYKALYTPTGKTIFVEKDMSVRQLPAAIAKSIKSKYPKGRIDDVDQINTGGKVTYKIDIEGTPDVNVWYAADGRFIKEVAD